MYFDEYQMGRVDGDLDKEFVDVVGVKAYVENRSECRRHLLTHAWDIRGVCCREVPNAIMCDICRMKQKGVLPHIPNLAPVVRTVTEALLSFNKKREWEASDSQSLLMVHNKVIKLGKCPFHLAMKGVEVTHQPRQCDLQRTHSEGASSKFANFSNNIKWQKGFVCFFCFFPHSGKDSRFHKGRDWTSCQKQSIAVPNDTCSRPFSFHSKQFVSGILWSLFCSKELRDRIALVSSFDPVPEDLASFCRYITNQIDGNPLPVGLALVGRILNDTAEKYRSAT